MKLSKIHLTLPLLLTIIFLTASPTLRGAEPVRTWKSPSGATLLEAVWDSQNDPNPADVYFLKGEKRYKIAFKNLSEEDQKYVTAGRSGTAEETIAANVESQQNVQDSPVLAPVVQSGHNAGVTNVFFTPDERYLLSCNFTESILWDIQTGSKLRSYPQNCALSPDGKTVFAPHYDKEKNQIGQFLDVVTGKTKAICCQEGARNCYTQAYCFDSSSQYLVTGHGDYQTFEDSTVRIWEVKTGRFIRELTGHKQYVMTVAISPSGDLIASGDGSGTVILWDMKTGEKQYQYEQTSKYPAGIIALAFSPDGSELISSRIRTLYTYNIARKTITERSNDSDFYGTMTYSPDGKSLFFTTEEQFISTSTKNELSVLPSKHTTSVSKLTYSHNGKWFATASDDQTVILWDTSTLTPVRQFGKPKHGSARYFTAMSPDDRWVAAGTAQGKLILFDKQKACPQWKVDAHSKDIRCLAFTPDNNYLVTGSEDKTTKLWRVSDGSLVQTFDESGTEIFAVAISSDGRLLASAGNSEDIANECIQIRDLHTGKSVYKLQNGDLGIISSLSFQPDSTWLASGGIHGVVLWDTAAEKEIKQLTQEYACSVAFSPDGEKLVTGMETPIETNRSIAYIWDVFSGRKLKTLLDVESNSNGIDVNSATFTHDNNRILTGNDEGSLCLWNANTGSLIKKWNCGTGIAIYSITIDSHANALVSLSGDSVFLYDLNQIIPLQNYSERFISGSNTLAFHPSSNRLAVGECGGAIQIWDLESGKLERNLFPGNSFITSLHFSPDGTRLWACACNKSVVCWETKNYGIEHYYPIDSFYHIYPSPNDEYLLSYLADYTNNLAIFEIFDPHGNAVGKKQVINDFFKDEWLKSIQWTDNHQITIETTRSEEQSDKDKYLNYKRNHRWDLRTNTLTNDKDGSLYELEKITLHPSYESKEEFVVLNNVFNQQILVDNGLLFHARYGGNTYIFEKETGKEICSLFSFNSGRDWLVVTPEGLFDGTPEARRMVSYRVGDSLNVQPVEAFFQDFYYPGLLGAIWKGERPMPNVKVKDQLPPEIRIMSPGSGETSQGMARFEVVLKNQGGGILKPSITVNGIGVGVKEKPVTSDKEVRWTFNLPLSNGENQVVIRSATADGQIACESQPVTLNYLTRLENPPRMFVLTVGVSDYQSGSVNDLECAAADAKALAKALETSGKKFYGNDGVFVQSLTDGDVTKVKIQDAIAEIAKKARPEDVFVFSLAGHGSTVGQLYYYYPAEFPFEDENQPADSVIRENGIGGDILNDWINSVPAMKRIVIYDTCQSEAALKRSAMEERKAMEQLSRMTGCFTIAAASGKDAAMELPDVGHGVLTYALLGGLGAAEKGLLKDRSAVSEDGFLRVRDWLGFAQDNVSKLSELSFGTEQRAIFQAGANNFPILKK